MLERCKHIKPSGDQVKTLNEVAMEKYGSVVEFGKAIERIATERKYSSYWMYAKRAKRLLRGGSVFPCYARALLAALENDSRLEFLTEVANQDLKTQKRNI